MLELTAHRLAGFDVESESSIAVKGSGSERCLVNGHQTQELLAAQCREEFAILKGDVDLKSLFAFVFAHVRLKYLGVNFGRQYCTCLLQDIYALGILVITSLVIS